MNWDGERTYHNRATAGQRGRRHLGRHLNLHRTGTCGGGGGPLGADNIPGIIVVLSGHLPDNALVQSGRGASPLIAGLSGWGGWVDVELSRLYDGTARV